MKGTDHFKKTILMYLEQRAEEDQLFAKSFSNPAKNIDDCVTYILNYVKNSGCNGFTDGEIFGQAIHYYEENEIEVGKPWNSRQRKRRKHGRRLSKNIKKRKSASCKTATDRQRKKKLLYNLPYLTFDYETQDTHTKRGGKTFRQPSPHIRNTN